MPFPSTLETSRLRLRRFESTDLARVAVILGHPEVMRFSTTGPMPPGRSAGWLARTIERYAERDGLGFLACLERGGGELVGFCGALPQAVGGEDDIEIGYRFHPAWWGRGLATEAARACRDAAFEGFDVDRLISIIEAANVASIGVAERNGMRHVRDAEFHGVSVRVYEIQRDEWMEAD